MNKGLSFVYTCIQLQVMVYSSFMNSAEAAIPHGVSLEVIIKHRTHMTIVIIIILHVYFPFYYQNISQRHVADLEWHQNELFAR